MVTLPFSSLQLNPSLAQYLELTPSQSNAIQRLMSDERRNLQPLIEQLRTTREKLLAATGSGPAKEKQVKVCQAREIDRGEFSYASQAVQTPQFGTTKETRRLQAGQRSVDREPIGREAFQAPSQFPRGWQPSGLCPFRLATCNVKGICARIFLPANAIRLWSKHRRADIAATFLFGKG